MHRLVRAAVLASVLAVPSFGAAQQAASEADARARRHFESGESYYEEGAYEDAAREFAQAYRLSQRPALLYNLYSSEERSGRLREAAAHLEQYLREVPDAPDRPLLEARLQHLRARVASEASGTPPTGTPPTGTPPTGTPATGTPPTDTPSSSTPSSSDDGLLVPAVVALAVGGVGLATFGVAGGMALSEDTALRGADGCSPDCTDGEVAQLRTLTLVADIGLVTGVVAAGVGAALLGVHLANGGAGESVAVVPVVSPAFVGMTAGGSF